MNGWVIFLLIVAAFAGGIAFYKHRQVIKLRAQIAGRNALSATRREFDKAEQAAAGEVNSLRSKF